jgi:S1-C subfamily serine protease
MKRLWTVIAVISLLANCAPLGTQRISTADTEEKNKPTSEQLIYENADYATQIFIEDSRGGSWTMSGFFYQKQKPYVITASHIQKVEDNIFRITVRFKYSPCTYEVKIFKVDRRRDIAALALPENFVYKGRQIKLGNSADLTNETKVITIGSPEGIPNCLSRGQILKIGYQWPKKELVTCFTHNALAMHGSSGGVVLNEQGELIGMDIGGLSRIMVDEKTGERDDKPLSEYAISVPVNEIKTFLESLK